MKKCIDKTHNKMSQRQHDDIQTEKTELVFSFGIVNYSYPAVLTSKRNHVP